jgi:hypothetical protein
MAERHEAQEAAGAAKARRLKEAAERALAEAQARRKTHDAAESNLPKEVGGRGGLEPVRYGDWEVKGIASDF